MLMKTNFLNLVAKTPQNTGGGNSQTKRATLALPLRYLCAMLLALILGVGQMWADTFTAAEIAAESGSVNVGTTKNHVTVSLPGITATSNVNYAKISGTQKKRDMVEVSGKATSGSITTDKVLSVKVDRGYKLVSPVKINGSSSSTSDIKMAYVGWQGQPEASFQLCNGATDWKFDKNSITSEPVDREIAFATTIRAIYLYTQIKTATDSYNSFGTSKTVGSGTKAYVYTVDASAVLAPEIEGESQMWNNETIELVGYPTGGAWAVVSGPGSIASDGKLTANGNGTIRVSYTVDAVSGIKDIVAGTTKQYTWLFNTNNVMPTTIDITAQKSGGSFESQGQLKLGSNGDYAYIDLTSLNYLVTAAVINGKTGSTGDGKNIGFGSAASNTQDGTTADATESTYTDYAVTPTKSSSIFSVIKTSGTSAYIASITLTVKKAVACTVAPTVSATTKGATTSTTQVVNCAGISSLGSEGCSISSYGFVYGTGETPNIEDDTPVEVGTSYSTINTAFAETTLTGLTASTTYYVRAYATNGSGTAYGDAVSFTTSAACTVAPTVSAISKGTTSYTTQVMNCAGITSLGSAGCAISSYGFVYGTTEHPTTANSTKEVGTSYTVVETAFAETTLTGLTPNTTYYVRAYATNDYGTAYSSDELSFTTLETIGNVAFIASSTSVTNDAITALLDAGYNVTVREKAAEPDYTGVDLVVLDESLSWANSDEGGSVIAADVPILNLKAFFYTKGSSARWNWGTPVNPNPLSETATLSTVYTNIASHPIFKDVTITAGAVDMVNPSKSGNNLQGVTTNTLVDGKQGYTLATSATGTTCIHELTPGQRGVTNSKYLLIALSSNIKDNYSADAKKMIVNAAKYLIGNTSWVPVIAPKLLSSVPANSATNIAVEGNIVLTFSENVTLVDASKFSISPNAGVTLSTPTVSGAVVTIPYSGLANSTEYTFATAAGAVKNGSDVPNAALSNIVFTTEAACTKPGTPANLAASNEAFTTADLSWDAAANADGYKISIIKKEGEDVILDWTDNATTSYAATGLTQGTEYTFKVKAKGATEYCEYGLEATVDFTTTTPSVADLVEISDDWTFTPSATIAAGALAEGGKLFAPGPNDCDMSGGKMRIKENRALAFKVAANAKVRVTFTTNGNLEMQLGTATTDDDNKAYGHSKSSPFTSEVISTGGVVYLTASEQLYMSKLEILYPHTVTYALNGGDGTPPTQEAKYIGETFTAHDGVTGITAPATKEFDKWVDQDAADVAGGTTYTMPAKAVILTAQWKNETVKYSVTYDLGDYTSGVAPTETNKAAGDVITIKAAPARDSYNFLGWKCDVDAETYQANVPYTMTAAPTTFTAQWQEFFTITYKDGDDVLATEKVNKGSSPVGIEAPTKALKTFEGWTLVGETDLIDPTTLTETSILVAKWADFDGCAYMAIDREATAVLAADDDVALESASFGGGIKVKSIKTSGSIAYNANGLYFSGGNADKVSVNLTHQMQVGTKITVALRCPGTGTRGLNLLNKNDGAVNSGTMLGWTSGVTDAEETFSYTVTAADGLDGEKVFVLQRNGTIYLQYVTVEDCAPQDFTVTYKDGETTLGAEDVFENAHPTAAGIVTRKGGYIFQGWAETKGGDVVDLDDITITAAKTLYAKYTARDCSGIGTKYKFQLKTDLTSGNMFATAPVPATAMTTENYLSEIVGGELEVSNTNNNNNRVVISDQKAIGFSGGDGGKLTLYLNCPLQENDEIRFINYASSGNSITLSDGTNNTTLNGNGTETIQTFTIPEAWETTGSYVLTMVRGNSTAKLTYFEIYRRPVLTDVTLNDLTIRTEQALAPQMTLTPIEGMVTSQEWEITDRTGATGATINPSTGVVTAGTETGTLTVQVTVNGTFVRTCTVTIINIYTSLVPVTGTTSWNWAGSATGEPTIDDVENKGTILANYINGANFEKLEGKAGEYAYRSSQYPCYQGTQLHFVTTVPGMLKINARNSASGQRISVNSHEVTTSDLTSTVTEYSIVVPAGDVMITSNATNVRIYSMTFDTKLENYEITDNVLNGYTRDVNPQYYGTICLPKAGVIVGATLFELAYMDYKENKPYKVYYDEIINGELEAGMPYIFLAHESTIGVFYTGTATNTAQDKNGLHGTLEDITSGMNGENKYMLYNNQVLHSTSPESMLPANRAYIQLDEVPGYGNPGYRAAPAKPGRRRISTNFNAPQIATGLEDAAANETPVKVLINGEMFIIRGEKMYDATGRLVK